MILNVLQDQAEPAFLPIHVRIVGEHIGSWVFGV
jgi:hypothetical protein